MRVLHIIAGIQAAAGGPVSAMVGLARAQKILGLKVHVAATWWRGSLPPTADKLRHVGAEVTAIGPCYTSLNWLPNIRRQLRPLVESNDIIHIHGLFEEIQHQAAVLSYKLGKPYIFHPCGMLDRWSQKRKWLKKKLYWWWRLRWTINKATALHFATTWERDQSMALGLKPPAIVVPNGVDLDEFQKLPARGTFRREFPDLAHRRLILFLGRVHPGKGLEYLIPAMAQVTDPAVMLMVVGPDCNRYMDAMRQLARQKGVFDRVVFTGMAEGLRRVAALADADLFALPSQHENFGIAVVEAMAAGLPVIVSDQVAIQDTVVNSGAGEVVPLNIDRLADALNRWMADEDMRRRAGKAAREVALSEFSWQRIAYLWADAYLRCIG